MTFGTCALVVSFGPFETLIWTCVWKGTVMPAAFACWTTFPSGSWLGTKKRLARIPTLLSAWTAPASLSPTTSGIVALCGDGLAAGAVVVGAVVVGAVVVVAAVVDAGL